MSPIGDALNRARDAETTIGTPSDQLGSEDTADELATMASTDSELSRQIDAQLSGAKVTFDGVTSTITPEPDAPPAAAPTATPATQPAAVVQADTPRQPAATAQTAAIERIRLAREEQRSRDAAAGAQPGTSGRFPARLRTPASSPDSGLGKTVRIAPFVLIAMFILLGFDRMIAMFGVIFGIGAGLLLLVIILRQASRTGRKTTDMPKDDQFDRSL